MTGTCPECGTPVSGRAAVCPHCGFPLGRDFIPAAGARGLPPGYGPAGGIPGAPPPKRSSTAGILVAVVAGGFALVVVIGILAALAIPRFTRAAARAKEREGTSMLRQAYIAEQRYYADHGEFTANLGDLEAAGWTAPSSPNYTLRVSDTRKDRLCLEAEPKPGAAGVSALSMDGNGEQYSMAGCGYPDAVMEPPAGARTTSPSRRTPSAIG